jgi:hypothetical protein
MLAANRLGEWFPKVKAQLKSICDQVIFVNEFGHHFKHYGQFNPACFPNTEVQSFVMSEELAEMATAFGIDLGILLEERQHRGASFLIPIESIFDRS